ncbi:Bifunctional NAD(P)H-hydrate repair enzyme Nnr [Labrenzia sp. THAF82]|uniref:NAD(P)H-hydrate dehydratase n=1 Tax=Labrenzia sp. THAF82 TaxID=2587861 RepID=UPI001268AF27|nr:NAD(P)H-hydrate dehydratase [Labrenzia sp. THAF82]QFT31959.1 Bifunctional NAD(P)H-hydrate repair enzyme Nnr [Labrenzia sp. THAF82]
MTTDWHSPYTFLLSPTEMGRADRLTIEGGIAGIELMEQAGQAVVRAAVELVSAGARILILCGPGNNGGDGFIAARCLAAMGYGIDVLLISPADRLKGDARLAFERMGLPAERIGEGQEGQKRLPMLLDSVDLIIDGLFGAGLDRPLEGEIKQIVDAVNDSGKPVLAIDLPSGVNGASGQKLGSAVRAQRTVTFFCEKPGHLLFPGRELCGAVVVAQIGIRPDVFGDIRPQTFENAPALWRHAWPMASQQGHKYTKGHAVVFSGSVSSTGAARLGAAAALRAGAGLVTLASPPDAMMVNACHLTAVMLKKLAGEKAVQDLLSDERYSSVLIGPGFGIGAGTRSSVEAILRASRATVLDADALTSFSETPEHLFSLVKLCDAPVVLTPHEGEFARIFPQVEGDKLARARLAARLSGATLILKGPDTVIASPDGRAAINHNAPPWLATAGSGDVLAGITTGLLAQGVSGFEAACQAVWFHGEAGNIVGPGLIAEDLAPALKEVLRALVDKFGEG